MKLEDILTIRNSVIATLIAGAISGLFAFLVNKDSATTSTNIKKSNNISVDNSQKNYNNSTVIENQNIKTQIINNRDKETEQNNKFLKEDISGFINDYNELIDEFFKDGDLTNSVKIIKKAIERIKEGEYKEGIKILDDKKIEKDVKLLDKLLYEFEILNKKENKDIEKLVDNFEETNKLRKIIFTFYKEKSNIYRALGDKAKAKFYDKKAEETNNKSSEFLFSIPLFSDKLPWCRDIVKKAHNNKEFVKENSMCKVNLLDIYPTQSIIGEVVVNCKIQKLEKSLEKYYDGSEKEFRKDYLYQKKTFLPIVIGYEDRLYITDHHHLSSAILESTKIDKKELNAFILHDYSHSVDWQKINEVTFWDMMDKEKLVYLKEFGKNISYQQLPTCLNRLKNDPFRTLSRWVRDSGCYTKEEDKDKKEYSFTNVAKSLYYAEFKYADILRDKFNSELNIDDEVKSLIDIYPKSIKYLKDNYNCSNCEEIKWVDESNYCKKFDL